MTASTVHAASAISSSAVYVATTAIAAAKRTARPVVRSMQRSGLSPLGWATIAISLVCIVTGIPLDWRELLAAGFASLSMVACAIILGLQRPKLAATLSVQSARVTVGDTIDIGAHVTADQQRHQPAAAHCLLHVGDKSYRLAFHPNAPNNLTDRNLTVPASRRSVVPVGPLTVTTGDPLGLVRRSTELASAINVHVHPRLLSLGMLPNGTTHDLEGQSSSTRASNDIELYDVRDYMPGDDLRHIHWPSTAKTGSLMVRQYQATQRTAVALLLDRNACDYASPEEFELAVTLYASIGAQALHERRLLITGMGMHHNQPVTINAFLDHCSALQPVVGERGTMPLVTGPVGDESEANESTVAKPKAAKSAVDESAAEFRYLQHDTASLHIAIVGSQLPLEAIHRFARTLPAGLVIILRSAIGEPPGTVPADGWILATVGAVQDLPMIMGALR